MKISLDWLKDYVDIDVPLGVLRDKLTMIGLIAETVEERDGDVVLDLETYANRPDTLGHLGMAREIAALLGRPLKEKAWPLVGLPNRTAELCDVRVQDEDLCPRYCGLVVRGVTVGSSPDALRRRLEAVGLHAINSVVDATNYVLFATGQPIHAFDLAKLAGPSIIVRRAKKGEHILTLDGKDVALTPEMLVIADEKKPVAVAGVIGGQDSAVTEATRDVFIESAVFDPGAVRKTRLAMEILTDASYRFERGADIGFAPSAAFMAASLMTASGGKAAGEMVDVYPHPRKPREISLRARRVAELLGVEVKPEFIEKTLGDLAFVLKARPAGAWTVQVPSHRVDIEREADLVEEIARFYGYDRIPSEVPPLPVLESAPSPEDKTRPLAERLFHYGFDEVINQSFTDPERLALFDAGKKPVALRNPLSGKASVLRTTLLGHLLENTAWNRNRGQEGVHIFEIGDTYRWAGEDVPAEDLTLAVSSSGPLGPLHWKTKPAAPDFFYLKGTLESALQALRYEPLSVAATDHRAFEEARAVQYKGERIGVLGRVKAAVLAAFEIKGPVFAAEIDLGRLFKMKPRAFEFTPLPKFPAVVRDLSFWIDRQVAWQEIEAALAKVDIPFLERIDVLDRYAGSLAPEGRVGLSARFTYRHPKATLTAEEVDKAEAKIVKALKAAFGIKLREGGSA